MSQSYNDGGSGGFMADGGDGGGGQSKVRNNSLRPVTVHQVLNISQAHPDAPLELDGKEIDQLTLVGIVTELTEGTTFSTIQVDDGTGQIPVKVWADQGMDSEEGNSKLSDIRANMYVRLIGTAKNFQNKTSLSAGYVRPVTDSNEIFYHKLAAAYTHLVITRGDPGSGGGGGEKRASEAGVKGMSQHVRETIANIEIPHGKEVFKILWANEQQDSEGARPNQIAKRLDGQLNADAVRDVLHQLAEGGFTYENGEDQWTIV